MPLNLLSLLKAITDGTYLISKKVNIVIVYIKDWSVLIMIHVGFKLILEE